MATQKNEQSSAQSTNQKSQREYQKLNALRVLHVAATSVPHINGYTMRLQSILREQARRGLDVLAITSPFYPGRLDPPDNLVLDQIEHKRSQHPAESSETSLSATITRTLRSMAKTTWCPSLASSAISLVEEKFLLRRFQKDIEIAAREHNADVIHAHTPYRCGLPAIRAGARLGIPVVYEVRGLWEDTAVVEGQISSSGAAYRHVRSAENQAIQKADVVVAIGESLADDYISRGASADRIVIAPNGADLERLGTPSDSAIQAVETLREKINGATVVGYVGSIRPLEGVQILVEAIALLIQQGHNIHGLIVGDGDSRKSLIDRSVALGIGDRMTFTGRVPANDVGAYYDMIDIFAVTRDESRVTNLVTPIKPLEAMGRGKPVIMSALPALRELGESAKAARYYIPGHVEDLVARIIELYEDPSSRIQLGEHARAWVTAERTWSVTVDQIEKAYEQALSDS